MSVIKKVLLLVIGFAVIILFVFWGKIFGTGYTTQITDDAGEVISKSVATLEQVELGGMDQNILIRGYDIDNPVLLWLHGGPGSSQMPIANYYDKELEKEFTVVHWDQRGSGKSNPADFNETMTYDRFIADGHQLTSYLKDRLNKEKVYLLGHSWGSQLGLELINRYPEDYQCYIGVSQVVNNTLQNKIAYPWLLEQITRKGDRKDLERLEQLGNPPFTDHAKFVQFVQLVDAYGGGFDLSFTRLLWISLQAPEYSLRDYWGWLEGSSRGSGQMWKEDAYSSFNALQCVPTVKVPVYFFSGERDYNTPLQAVQQYYEKLTAPRGKELIIFRQSAHTPFLGQPDKFYRELIRVKKETLAGMGPY